MILKPWLVACIAIFAAIPALAKSSSAKPLDLKLPLQFTPAAASTAHSTAKSVQVSKSRQYSAHLDNTRYTDLQPPYAFPTGCNNKAYKRPRVSGSVALGAFSGSDIEGNYQTGTVNITKALGDCNHPSDDITFSFGFGRETVNGPFWHH